MKNKYAINNVFKVSILLIAIAAALIFSIGKDSVQIDRRGDAAIHEQLISNIWIGKGAVSNVFAATQNFIDRRYASQPISNLIDKTLEPPIEHERNMLSFHAYYVLFFICPLVSFMPSSLVLVLLQSICFFGVLVAVTLLLLKETRSKLAALLFLPIILLNPNWVGGLYGQFYPDRLFVLFGFLFCYACYRDTRLWVLVLLTALVASINERAAFVGGLILLYVPWVASDFKNKIKYIGARVALGIVLVSYSYIQKNYILTNLYYSSFLPNNIDQAILRFSLDGFIKNSLIFLGTNAVMLIISFVKPRLAFLTLLVMLPNIIGNIGGAEKIGWLTHYHSYYFPLLIFSSVMGFADFYNKHINERKTLSNHKVSISIYISLLLVMTLQFSHQLKSYRLPSLIGLLSPIESLYNLTSSVPTGYSIRKNIAGMVDEGALVSTDELGMALLYDRVSIDVFPVSVLKADYLFLPCMMIQNELNIGNQAPILSSAWLLKKGFDPASMIRDKTINYCVVSKIK